MNKDEEYRRLAAEAEGLADKAKSDRDRAAWLRIAQGWLGLVQGSSLSPQENFDERAEAAGTGQEPSTSTH